MTDETSRQDEQNTSAGVKWREPTIGETAQFALTDNPYGETDQESAAKADMLGRVYFDLLEKANQPVDPKMDDDDARAEAVYFTKSMTGMDDVPGKLWRKGGFATGKEYLAYMRDFFKRSPEDNKTQELKDFEALDEAGQTAAALDAQKKTDWLKHLGGNAATALRDYVLRYEPNAVIDVEREEKEKKYQAEVRSAYHAKLLADNAWIELSGILPRLSADGRACTKALMDSPDNKLPTAYYAKFNNLPDEEKQMLIRARTVLAPRVEGSFANWIGDMGVGLANISASLAAAPVRFGNKLFAKGWLDWIPGVDSDFFDLNEISRRRQYLWQATGDFVAGGEGGFVPQLQFEQICEDHGFVAESLIGAVTTLPYMAVAAVPVVGIAEVALEAMSEMDDHVAMNGGDITDGDYMLTSAILGAMYAYTERLQIEGLLGGVSDLKMREAMLKGVWAGIKDGRPLRNLAVGTFSESLQEGVQNGIMSVNEALALNGDAVRAFGEGFTEDFVGSIGTMFVVEASGIVGGHVKRSGFRRGAEGHKNRSKDLEKEYGKFLCQRQMVDYEGQSVGLRTAMQSLVEGRLYNEWKDGGKDALVKAGVDPVQAEEYDYYFQGERDRLAQEEETGEAVPMDKRSVDAQRSLDAYLASEAKKLFNSGRNTDADLAAFDLAMENLDWVRQAWAQGHGVMRKDGDETIDPGAKAIEALGFTSDVAARLSRQFAYERAAAYSPAALAGIKHRYEQRMQGKVTAKAAIAEQFGGQLVHVLDGDFLQFNGKDGSISLVRIDERNGAGIDFGVADEGVAVDVERATNGEVTKADWMKATAEERQEIWNRYGLVHEGSFAPVKVSLQSDPSAGVDSNQARKLIGTISIDSATDPNMVSDTSSVFHEVFHAFCYFARASGLWTKEDIAYLEKTFGKAKHSQEVFDEEAAAEAFRTFLARRAAGAMTVEDEQGPFARIYAAAAGLDRVAAEKAVQTKMQDESENAFFHQLIAETNKPKPPAPAQKPTLPKSAAPQKGIKPAAPSAPAQSNNPPIEQSNNSPVPAPTQSNNPPIEQSNNSTAPKLWTAYTPTGNIKVSGHWAVLDLKDVIHSNNPLYAIHMRAQLRNRKDNKAEEDTRKDIVNNFQGERLLEAPDTANGAPIVFLDRDESGTVRPFVLSGNGRVLVLNELAERHLYDHYRNVMKKWAAENGIFVPEGETPILVRVIDDYGGASRDKVADLSNTNSIQQYTEEEQARADAEVIKALGIARLYIANADGSADMTPGVNDEFFSEFVRGVGDTSLYNSDRSLTQAARDRAQRALLAIAVGQGDRGRAVTKKLVEQTETLSIQRQKNAAMIVAADVAALETNAAYAIGPDVSRAMADFMDYAEKKKASKIGTFAEYFGQMDLLDKPSAVAREILQLFGSDHSAADIAAYVKAYCRAASMEDPSGGLFGAARTREEIWNDAAKFVDEELKKRPTRHSISRQEMKTDAANDPAARAYLDALKRPDANEQTTLLAPNGKRSNLTNALYHLVRTKRFKDWFGDWEKLARRNAIDNAPTPTIEVGAFVRNEGESVQDAAKKYFNGSVKYKTVVGEVEIDARSGKDSLAHKYGKEKLDAITSIQRDFANAVYLGSERDFDGKDIDNHYFCYPINYDGKRRLVFCRARQDVNKNRLYVHEVFLEDEIKSNALQTAAPASESQKPHGGIALYRSILQSVYAVNPASVSKVVDENGEPLVVYHGGRNGNDFSVFDRDKAKRGFYFAPFARRDSVAGYYGHGNERPFFLNLKNPLVKVVNDGTDADNRHDGIISKADGNSSSKFYNYRTDVIEEEKIAKGDIMEIVAFNPEQIKSADPVTYDDAGNVIPLSQRFDANRGDIRFSISNLYTGSAADYEKPSLLKVGTGEGSQVYGWGLYASDVRGVAEGYSLGQESSLRIDGKSHYDSKEFQRGGKLSGILNRLQNVVEWNVEKGLSASEAVKEGLNDSMWTKEEKKLLKPLEGRITHSKGNLYEQTFFTNRAPGDESHLLKWYEPVSEENLKRIVKALNADSSLNNEYSKTLLKKAKTAFLSNLSNRIGNKGIEEATGADVYKAISELYNTNREQNASEFLARADIDGIKYPVDSYGKTVKDGDKVGWNYVSFRDDNVRVDHKWVDGQKRWSVAAIANAKTSREVGPADIEQDARRAITAAAQDGGNEAAVDALENYVAYFKLAHGPLPRPRTLARIGLSLGMNVVDPKRILKNADKLAERMRGTTIEKAAKVGNVGTAMALLKQEKDLDKRMENLLAEGVKIGGQLTHKGVGQVNALLQKRVERLMGDFTAATLADMEGDTGIDLAAEILENNPDAFETEYRKAKKLTEEQEGETADQQESAAASAVADPLDESEMSDADRYKRQVLLKEAAARVAKFIEDAKRRAAENNAQAADRRAKRRIVEVGGEFGEDAPSEEVGGQDDRFNPTPKDVKAGFKTPEEFAAFLRVWAADRFAKQHGHTNIAKAQRDRLFAEFYRICARQELQDLADKLLAPKMMNAAGELVTNAKIAKLGNGARAWVNRRLQEMEKGIRPDSIERMSANIFAFINKAAIRVSRVDLITNFKNDLKERFLHDPEFDEFKQDTERKVTGWVEEATRYICRVCDLSRISANGDPSQLEQEYRKLHEIIDRRAQVYDESGREVTAAAQEDAETLKAQWKLALLDKYGAMRSMMPGEILDLQNAAFKYLEEEAAKLEEAWRETRAQQDQVRRDFCGAIVGPNGQKYQEKGLFNGRLFDALNGLIRLRLKHLTRFASDAQREKAKDAVNSIMVMLGDGETAYAKALQADREAFFVGLGQIFRKSDGSADNAAIRKYLERLDEPIPVDLSRQISNQGYAESMTHGQLLQLLVSLEQRSFKDAIKANGREGQAELIRSFRYRKEDGTVASVITSEDSQFIEMLRAFYAAKRDQLSEVTERMVGHKVDSPDPLYMPIRRWIDDKARGLHSDPTQRWDPISKIFSRRVESDRDFDESRTIIGLFFENSKESAKLTAWAERGSFIRNIVTSVGFQASVKRAFGNGELGKILKQLEATFNGGEQRSQTPGEVAAADKAVNFVTYAYLGFNPLSAIKQTTSAWVWANVLDGGFADLWRHMTHFDSKVLKHLMESDEYKVRYGNEVGSGMDYATKGLNMNPSQNAAMRAISGAGMWLLKRGDFVPGGWIAQGVYKDLLDKHLKEGMDEAAADKLAITETFNLLEETQQSGRTYNTNMLQIEHGRIGRLLTQFATSPLQQLQYETQAWREWRDMVRYQMGENRIAEARQRFLRAAFINHVLLPAALNLVVAMYKAAMGEEPPWEKDGYHWTLLIDLLMGQFSRVFFLGSFSLTTLNALFKREAPRAGQMLPVEGAFGMAASGAFLVHDLVTMDYDKVQKDLERAIKASAPTRLPYNVYRRITGDSDQDRKAKKKAK